MTTAIQPPLLPSLAVKKNAPLHMRTPSLPTSAGRRRCFAVRSTKEDANSKSEDDGDDDVSFLLKLGGGSFAGAAAIKYGSILVPEITRPNITQALVMISTPVILALLLLIKQSRLQQ
ncbi:hypothetical protein HanRHA438_Chr10g0461941 [Helianthus annuus]|uniref:Uncharacterized protein n=1 Tax=Helianthus annuus TaxID=4232 RepID=A0A251TKZ9_HELAN|nr:uncharacterized protein LOC110885726 [Helianthus annuus]KAF5787133.1 hypothetical protein HanXRQr2_Chr10g0449391 [Helianthus annuus]KAJ0514430.1 hypothetical protein HanHA300_Chr10g0369451 [Helianthus annuus]KAJ0522612.1 hypothetical protein HanIR_Chr10g0484511 [Helianthus annuus]KAJ0880332.1 hypothetical protein HanRHA438_Chr10g0461941 [Helianthus annuus]